MNVTDRDFDEKVIEGSKKNLILVDFWASWCMPCNMLAPIVEKVVESYKGKVVLAKVNVDECSASATKYDINAIPALKLFKNGKIVGELTGLVPEDNINKLINSNIKK